MLDVAVVAPGNSVLLKEAEKKVKYAPLLRARGLSPDRFIPFVVEATGGLAEAAMAFLGELLAADPDLQDPIFFARRRIVASLMKTLSEDTMLFREGSTVGYYEAF